jgi:uncharacterized protein YuzE
MKTAYDQDADALYVALLDEDEPVSRSVELDEGTLVDLDRFGHVIGIEVIRPARSWPLDEVLSRFSVNDSDRRALVALFDLNGEDRRFPFVKRLVGAA